MKIGELAKATDCAVETIRYYERENLLPAPARSDGNYRLYTQAHVERLTFIRNCRTLDMTLDEIRSLLSVAGAVDRTAPALQRTGGRMRDLAATGDEWCGNGAGNRAFARGPQPRALRNTISRRSGFSREHRQSRCQPPRRLLRGRALSHRLGCWLQAHAADVGAALCRERGAKRPPAIPGPTPPSALSSAHDAHSLPARNHSARSSPATRVRTCPFRQTPAPGH